LTDEARSRSNVLKLIKAAEMEGAKREENARAKAAQIKSAVQTECARMVEKAEKDGRTAMRKSVEDAKAECARVKDVQVTEAVKKGKAREAKSKAKIPAVAEMIFIKFKKEHDVKN